jgi:hypothetical protein
MGLQSGLNNLWKAVRDQLSRLLGGSPGDSTPSPPGDADDLPGSLQPRVLLIIYNPVVRSQGNRKLTQVLGWNDPDQLCEGYISDLRECSGGWIDYQIVERIEVGSWPVKQDGFRYDAETYLRNWRTGSGWHDPDAVDYGAILSDFDILARVELGRIDEVWLFASPFAGFYESRMVGPGAFWCNAPPLERHDVSRRFVIMGYNYERGVGEMLESFGHRIESHLDRVWRNFGDDPEHNLWRRFTLYDMIAPGRANCGNVHFAPNSRGDYDWGNPAYVPSNCDDWLNFPNFQGLVRQVNCQEWGNGEIRAHHKWWLEHLPKAPGDTSSIANNWWWYAVDPNIIS